MPGLLAICSTHSRGMVASLTRAATLTFAVFLLTQSAPAQGPAVNSLSAGLSEIAKNSGRKTIAVVDFTDLQGCVTELGRYMAEDVSVALVNNAKGFDVIDRTNLRVLMQEHKLVSTGIIDPATARKLGQVAGVDALVTGTIAPLSDSVHVSTKLLDTESAKVLGGITADIPRTKTVDDLLAKGITNCGQGPVDTPRAPSNQQQLQTLEYHQYRFDLQSCSRVGSTVECNLTVTNRGSDQNLTIYGSCNDSSMRSRLIDTDGRETLPKVISLGSHQNASWSCATTSAAVSGTNTRLVLSFENVTADIASIALLELTCHEGPDMGPFGERFRVQFRNVPVSQKRY